MDKKLSESEYLTSYNFARLADIVFAELLTTKQFKSLNQENVKILSSTEDIVSYKVKNLIVKNGDIIFSNSGTIDILFYYLNKLKNVDNITLITSQTDHTITEKIYKQKPSCIKKWYSINVAYEDNNLIPIPLGLANEYSPKNLMPNDFINYKDSSVEKINKLYINMQKSTNFDEREDLDNKFSNYDWSVVKGPNLSFEEYLKDLHKYNFVLCPWGNGFDTHRLWETLYAGSIPVTKYHRTYDCLRDLPVIFVENYNGINIDFLLEESKKLNKINTDKLSINFWKNEIHNSITEKQNTNEVLNENKFVEFLFYRKKNMKYFVNNKIKLITYYKRKFKKFTLRF